MTTKVTMISESIILDGKADELKALLKRVVAHCKATEPGMLIYNWYFNAEETECRVLEQYKDSDAVLFHFQNYAPFGEELAACRKPRQLTLLGKLSPVLKEAMAPFKPLIFEPVIGLDA